jgi:tRNA (guanine37-N1)-methyltransferase
LLQVDCVDVRQFGEGKWRKVDDRPFGGGPGMVMMAGPLTAAIRSVRTAESHVVYLSPQGRRLQAGDAKRLAAKQHLILVCGHYEGIDERVVQSEIDEEVSIGDYVLTNGCLPALVLIDALARFIPGVLSTAAAEEESFEAGSLDWPHYTRPLEFEGCEVPAVLRSGDHRAIARWREGEALAKTVERRPDLVWKDRSPGVMLWVRDLQVSLRFYQQVLGWEAVVIETCKAIVQTPSLQLVLLEGDRSETHQLYERGSDELLHRLERGEYPFQRDGKGLEIRDPDGHHWSIGW